MKIADMAWAQVEDYLGSVAEVGRDSSVGVRAVGGGHEPACTSDHPHDQLGRL